jgi:hypothetical protein
MSSARPAPAQDAVAKGQRQSDRTKERENDKELPTELVIYETHDAISVKIECLYVSVRLAGRRARFVLFDNTFVADGSVSFTESLVRVGVNYKFSWQLST